jgi:hypothetical protein
MAGTLAMSIVGMFSFGVSKRGVGSTRYPAPFFGAARRMNHSWVWGVDPDPPGWRWSPWRRTSDTESSAVTS